MSPPAQTSFSDSASDMDLFIAEGPSIDAELDLLTVNGEGGGVSVTLIGDPIISSTDGVRESSSRELLEYSEQLSMTVRDNSTHKCSSVKISSGILHSPATHMRSLLLHAQQGTHTYSRLTLCCLMVLTSTKKL